MGIDGLWYLRRGRISRQNFLHLLSASGRDYMVQKSDVLWAHVAAFTCDGKIHMYTCYIGRNDCGTGASLEVDELGLSREL